jgi:hypothetical protein
MKLIVSPEAMNPLMDRRVLVIAVGVSFLGFILDFWMTYNR